MMSTPEHTPSSGEEIDRINDVGVAAVKESARFLCDKTITVGYATMDYHLRLDKATRDRLEEQDYPNGVVSEMFITESKFHAPRTEHGFVKTFSIRLEPTTNPEDRFLRVHLPAGQARIQNYEMPAPEDVVEAYVEHYNGKEKHWYAIDRSGLYEYLPLSSYDEDPSVLDDQGIWQWLEDRIPESLGTINTLFTDMINWHTVSQKQISAES